MHELGAPTQGSSWHTPDPFGTAAIPAAIGGTREVLALTKGCDAQDVVGNHAGVVVPDGTSRGATDQNVWVGPHRQAGAAAAVCLIAHDVAPLVAMDIATLVTGTDQMPDFMHEGKVGFGAGMVHDGKGFILIGANAGGLSAAVGIIDDENGDIGLVVVA